MAIATTAVMPTAVMPTIIGHRRRSFEATRGAAGRSFAGSDNALLRLRHTGSQIMIAPTPAAIHALRLRVRASAPAITSPQRPVAGQTRIR